MFKVLVAEDEPKSRGALISRLRGILGDAALIEAASDGNDAVDKALRVQPDVIFMDIVMPGKNGLEAAAVIKKQIQTVHIIFLTAYDRFDYAVGAIRSGGEDYILKPVGEVELRESLQKFFDLQTCVVPKTSPFESELAVWVQRHYAEDMALEDAAASMGMSPFYFSRQVKGGYRKDLFGLSDVLPHRKGQEALDFYRPLRQRRRTFRRICRFQLFHKGI